MLYPPAAAGHRIVIGAAVSCLTASCLTAAGPPRDVPGVPAATTRRVASAVLSVPSPTLVRSV